MKRRLIIHCSDSDIPAHGVEEIRRWHVEENEWRDIGYHLVIEKSGELKIGRPIAQKGAHTRGHNEDIGLCMCGRSGNFNNDQMKSLERFILDNRELMSEIKQHSDFDNNKPFCAGLTDSQMKYINTLI